jgi:signal transduction histidine kinase
MSFKEDNDSLNSASYFAHVINNINAGIWEYNINTNEVNWSDGFYRVLGYEPGEIESSYSFFYDQVLYHGDKKAFAKSINERSPNNTSTVQVRLLTKNDGYQWFENVSRRSDDPTNPQIYGSLTNIHFHKLAELQSAQKESLFFEGGKIARVAVWEADVTSMNLTLSSEGYELFDLNSAAKLSIDDAISFFEPDYRSIAASAIENIIKLCKSFDLELCFRSAKNRVFWVRFKAIPIINDYGKCISIRGIIQDIDQAKKREVMAQNALNLSNDQNKRLQNFAYIVSHNLRSHTGNLEFMVNLYNDSDSKEERAEVFEHIKSISSSLNTTVKHLEEVVKIQAEINKDKKLVDFQETFESIIRALKGNINDLNAKIEYDFSKAPEIEYIPAYLESIMQNLLTNALKYSAKNRAPIIRCHTFKMNSHVYLIFEDNGMGIDMDRFGNDVFGMYKTFHQNNDAKGIGLFITRNQVESLGGTIKLESTVDVGTKFTIKLT